MTASVYTDKTKENCTFAGASDVTFNGATTGNQAFKDGSTDYVLESPDGLLWEVGKGTYNFATKIFARNIIYDNSSGNQLPIDFGTGSGVAFQPISANQANEINALDASLSGVTSGGFITSDTPTTIDISAGEGMVINAYSEPGEITQQLIAWSAFNDEIVSMPETLGIKSFLITPLGTLLQVNDVPTSAQRRENILLGGVEYKEGVIKNVINTPSIVRQTANDYRDFISFFPFSNQLKDIVAKPNDTQLSFWVTSGLMFVPGINYHVDETSPNITQVPQKGSNTIAVQYSSFFKSGNFYQNDQNIIPKVFENPDDTADPLSGNNATIHYLYMTAGGEFYLQLGQVEYNNYGSAVEALYSDRANSIHAVISKSLVLIAQIVIDNDATIFDGIKANIFPIVQSSTGGGGSSNNAVNITYDNTLSGLSASNVQDAIDEDVNNLNTHITDFNNPHNVDSIDVGLGNVDNTSDLNKPISNATQTALDGKSATTHNHNSDYVSLDGSTPMTGDLSLGLNFITDILPGEFPGDAATFDQLSSKLEHTNGVSTGQYETIVPIPALAIDVSNGNVQSKSISADSTFTFTGWTANASAVDLYLTVTGTPVVTFTGVTFKTAPVLTAGLNVLTFTSINNGSVINGFIAKDFS